MKTEILIVIVVGVSVILLMAKERLQTLNNTFIHTNLHKLYYQVNDKENAKLIGPFSLRK
jgi:hypothetical protein